MVNQRRRILWFLTALCLLVAGYWLVQRILDAHSAVNLDNFARIGDGMSEGEVQDLLGRSGDYRNPLNRTVARGETLELEGKVFTGPCEARATVVDWVPPRGPYVRVAFDDQGRVFSKRLVNHPGDFDPNVLRKIRKWIRGY